MIVSALIRRAGRPGSTATETVAATQVQRHA